MQRSRRIPITIHPFFWLFAALIGWLNTNTLVGTLIWIVVIIISVFIHELGHALSAIYFGQQARIDFVALGGVTSYQGKELKLWQQFLIVLSGPLFGFFLFLFASFILQVQIFSAPLLVGFFRILQVVNLFWSVVNLFPIMPLDGGQLLRIVFEGIWGVKGIRIALCTGMILSGILSFFLFIAQYFIGGIIFFLFAYQSFDTWRKAKFLSMSDKDVNLKQEMLKVDYALKTGDTKQAEEILEKIREKAKSGLIFMEATQELAKLYFSRGEAHKVYELLVPIQKNLSSQGICLLHKTAYFIKDYSLVAELSSKCFQASSTQEVALMNARAFASLSQGKPAGGWLQSAYAKKHLDLEKILHENVFQNVAHDRDFQKFIERLK